MRRERYQPINDFGEAASWLTGFLSARGQPGGSRTLHATKFQDLIFRSFVHDDSEFQRYLTENKEAEPHLAELAGDVFTALFSTVIHPVDASAVSDRISAAHRPVLDGLLKDAGFPALKELCEDKELPAYSGCTAFCQSLFSGMIAAKQSAESYLKYIRIIEMLEDQAKETISILNMLLLPNSSNAPHVQMNILRLTNRLSGKQEQIKNLRQKVAQGVVLYTESLHGVIHEAVEKAQQSAAATSAMLTAWGDGSGEMRNTKENRELMEHIKSSKALSDMAQSLGRYREILAKKRKNGYAYGLGEKYDITGGNNIAACLSSEVALLGSAETEVLFQLRYQKKKLKQYRNRAAVVKGDGDMIVLIDESYSTSDLQSWAKAFALAMLDIAAKGKRKFALIHFASSEEVKVDLFEPGHYTSQDVMAAVEHYFGGGTDFEAPLTEALWLIEKGYEKADITIITDGECALSEDFAKRFAEQKLLGRITVTGILLDAGRPCGESLEQFCDRVYHARDMAEDEIALDILNRKDTL